MDIYLHLYMLYLCTHTHVYTYNTHTSNWGERIHSKGEQLSKSDIVVYLQVSKLSWIEKKMAATLFGKIPSSTVQEALHNFLKVHFVYSLF